MHKSIKVHHVPLTALVDTRSDATIFNIHAYHKLGSPPLKNYSDMLTEFGNSTMKPLGYFEVPIVIDNEEFTTNACVADSVSMSVDVILGTNILA